VITGIPAAQNAPGGGDCQRTHRSQAAGFLCYNSRPAGPSAGQFQPGSEMPYDEFFDQVKNAPLLIMDDFGRNPAPPGQKKSSTSY